MTDTEKMRLVAQWMPDIPCDRVIQISLIEEHPVVLVMGNRDALTALWGTPVSFATERAEIFRWTHPEGFIVETVDVFPEPLVVAS